MVTPAWHEPGMEITWKPICPRPNETRAQLPASAFAFPKERKEPLTDGVHVHSAIARFSQVDGVTDYERSQAFGNIKAAAQYYGVALHAMSWRDLAASSDDKASANP